MSEQYFCPVCGPVKKVKPGSLSLKACGVCSALVSSQIPPFVAKLQEEIAALKVEQNRALDNYLDSYMALEAKYFSACDRVAKLDKAVHYYRAMVCVIHREYVEVDCETDEDVIEFHAQEWADELPDALREAGYLRGEW